MAISCVHILSHHRAIAHAVRSLQKLHTYSHSLLHGPVAARLFWRSTCTDVCRRTCCEVVRSCGGETLPLTCSCTSDLTERARAHTLARGKVIPSTVSLCRSLVITRRAHIPDTIADATNTLKGGSRPSAECVRERLTANDSGRRTRTW